MRFRTFVRTYVYKKRRKSTKKNRNIQKKSKKSEKNLHNSKKSSTFAPAFEINDKCKMSNFKCERSSCTVVLAQLVEHRIVVPSVVGSSPIIHPKKSCMDIRTGAAAGLFHQR